ncbi:Tail fiber assembly protein [Vibrio crassostreae]|nr:Tail fiber assembly protein [Vibrio crassostreae]
MKIAYHYDYKTLIYQGESQIHKVAGYDEYILPQFSTWVAKPDFDEVTEQGQFDIKNQKWLVELKPVQVTAYHKKTQELKVFADASLVSGEYTLKKPSTQWDEWINNAWITNKSDKYIHDYAQVDATRSALYTKLTDPLESELARKQRQGETGEVQVLSARINALEAKVKAENPYPTPPTN